MIGEDSRAEFHFVPFWENPSAQLICRALLLIAAIGCLVVSIVYLAGPLSKNALIFSLLAAPIAVVFSVWRIWREWSGIVWLDNQGFVMETGAGKSIYEWSAARNMRLVTPSQLGTFERLATRFAGADEHRPFVEITLTRRPRVSLLGNRVGTNVVLGVPKLAKRLGLFLVDPQEFLTAAQQRRNL